MYDVMIIGGGFAGLAAATQLGRARRKVVVLDTGKPRNRFSPAAHGILGHDGVPPLEILAAGRRQLAAYSTVTTLPAEAVSVVGREGDLTVTTRAHGTVSARRLILAHGVSDTLPAIPGLQACWGLSVLHCPYCHGYEVGDRRLGFLAFPGHELMMATLYRDWSSDLVMFANGGDVDAATRASLDALGVRIIDAPVLEARHHEGHLTHIVTAESAIERDAIFVAPKTAPSLDLYRQLGCATSPGHSGDYITVGERQDTSVPGVFAAGDLARPMHNATFATAAGVLAGTMAHHSLLFPTAA